MHEPFSHPLHELHHPASSLSNRKTKSRNFFRCIEPIALSGRSKRFTVKLAKRRENEERKQVAGSQSRPRRAQVTAGRGEKFYSRITPCSELILRSWVRYHNCQRSSASSNSTRGALLTAYVPVVPVPGCSVGTNAAIPGYCNATIHSV
jgi:hypothetical protein